jgi:hypothetical protein
MDLQRTAWTSEEEEGAGQGSTPLYILLERKIELENKRKYTKY